MSYKEKNISVSLLNFSLILVFFLFRLYQMFQNDAFEAQALFQVWGIVIFCAVAVTILLMILTDIVPLVLKARRGDDDFEVDTLEDERDNLIDLKGTRITYTISSLGSFVAMLTFVFGQSALIMFSVLIFFSLFAQIIGDITRLALYRDGF
ncbi:MAG: hypothetical protein Phog2KO_20980 [Phototrophicaceae bacterium]